MIRIHTSLAVLSVVLLVAPLVAAPVPKAESPDTDKLLARVRVENVASLLAQPAVAKAVGLTDDQKRRIESVVDDMTGKVKAKFAAGRQPNGGAGAEAVLGVFGLLAELSGEYDAAVVKVLTPAQLGRLRQVQLQKEGPAALLGRHGVRAINPTAEQEDAMATELARWRKLPMLDEMVAVSSGAIDGGGNDERAAIRKVLERFCADTEAVQEAMLKALTKEQRAAWERMTGDPLPRMELLQATSAFGDVKVVKAIEDAQNAQLPPPPAPPQAVPAVVPAGGAAPPQLPPAPPPVEKK